MSDLRYRHGQDLGHDPDHCNCTMDACFSCCQSHKDRDECWAHLSDARYRGRHGLDQDQGQATQAKQLSCECCGSTKDVEVVYVAMPGTFTGNLPVCADCRAVPAPYGPIGPCAQPPTVRKEK